MAAKVGRDLRDGREVQEHYRRGHLIGKRLNPARVVLQHLGGPLDGVVDVAAVDVGYGVEGELERGHDPEVAPAALYAPEEVRILLCAHAQQLTVGGDDLGFYNAIGVEAVLAPQPGEAAARRVAGNAHVGGGAQEARKPELLGLGDHVLPLHAGLDTSGLRYGVDVYALHTRGVDEDATGGEGGGAVAGCHHPHAQAPLPGQAHRGDYVRRILGHDHERGALVGGEVPRHARPVVALVARRVGRTLQTGPEAFERRTLDNALQVTSHLGLPPSDVHYCFEFAARSGGWPCAPPTHHPRNTK